MSSDSMNNDRTNFNTVHEHEIFGDRDLPSWLTEQQISLACTTYQTSRLYRYFERSAQLQTFMETAVYLTIHQRRPLSSQRFGDGGWGGEICHGVESYRFRLHRNDLTLLERREHRGR